MARASHQAIGKLRGAGQRMRIPCRAKGPKRRLRRSRAMFFCAPADLDSTLQGAPWCAGRSCDGRAQWLNETARPGLRGCGAPSFPLRSPSRRRHSCPHFPPLRSMIHTIIRAMITTARLTCWKVMRTADTSSAAAHRPASAPSPTPFRRRARAHRSSRRS